MKPKILTKTTLHPTLSWLFVLLLVLLTMLLITTRTMAADADLLVQSFGPGFGNGNGSVEIDFPVYEHAIAIDGQGRTIVAGEKVGEEGGNFWLARYRRDGTLDTGFGDNGEVVIDFGGGIYDVAIQADGKIVAAGYADGNFAAARYHPDGSLDNSFGDDGKTTIDLDGCDTDVARAVTIDNTGRIILAGRASGKLLGVCGGSDFAVVRLTPNGALDSSFDGDGKHQIGLGSSVEWAWTVTVQADGKIVVIGFKDDVIGGEERVAIVRLHENGALDSTLDGDGKFSSGDIGNGRDGFVQPDGKIVVATTYAKLVRFNADGTVDQSFGNSGFINLDGFINYSPHIEPQANGTILVAGDSGAAGSGSDEMFIFSFTADGGLDLLFGDTGGYTSFSLGSRHFLKDMALPGNGRIILLNTVAENTTHLIRLYPDGSLDRGGRKTNNFSHLDDTIRDATVQPDGKLLVAGDVGVGSGNDLANRMTVARYRPDGTLDPTFGDNGIKPLSNYVASNGQAIALDNEGRILVAGNIKGGSLNDFILARYTPAGTLAPFGNNETLLTDVSGLDDVPQAILVQPDGKILVAGRGGANAAFVRYLTDGTLDPDFSNDGKLVINLGGVDSISALALQPDGKVIAAGIADNDFVVTRLLTNGSLDSNFGQGGKVVTDLSSGQDYAQAVAIQPDGKIVVGGHGRFEGRRQMAVARYHANGVLDDTFGAGGVARTDFAVAVEAHDMALEFNSDITLAGCMYNEAASHFALVRFDSSGQQLAIGADGDLTFAFGGVACAQALAKDTVTSDYYLAGYDLAPAGDEQFAVARIKGNGQNNQPPTAVPDSYTAASGASLIVPSPGVLENDSDPDGPALLAVLVEGPANGTLFLNPNGQFRYRSTLGFTGQDSFTYQASDGYTHSTPTTVTIQVEPNSPPVPADDTYLALEDTSLIMAAPGILGNDYEPDGEPVTIVFEDLPENGTFLFNQDGAFTYTPDPGFSGTESFTYYLRDTVGNESNTALVTIEVLPAGSNVPPNAVADSYTTAQNTPLTVAAPGVLGNDNDLNGDPLTAELENGPDHGSLALNPDGSFLYTPNQTFNGQDSFTYRAGDGNTHSVPTTVTIQVEPNSPPIAADDTYQALEDTPLTVAAPGILGNDHEPDGEPVTIVFETSPENGTFQFNEDGAFTYTPDPGFSGTELFFYYLRDTAGNESDTATVTINVQPAGSNVSPNAMPDSYETLQNTPLTIAAPGLLDNDSDLNEDPLTAELETGPTHGSLTLNPDGSFLYTPNQDFSGQDSFSYRAGDGILSSAPVSVTITVSTPPEGSSTLFLPLVMR